MKTLASRETAWVALETKLASLTTGTGPLFKTVTRKLKHWADVPPEAQPALYIEMDGEMSQPVRGLDTRVVLEGNLWIYVSSEGGEVGPVLNPVLDALDAALDPGNVGDRVQTLGGVVHHCWVEGQTQISEGNLGDEAVAIVPIKMLVT